MLASSLAFVVLARSTAVTSTSLAAPSPPHSSLGILNVTAPPFSIDNTGVTDVTVQLQAAIAAAYGAQLALFLPPGRYLVSDTLHVEQNNYGSSLPVNIRPSRFRPNVIIGSTSALPQRPTFVLQANSRGFNNPLQPKNVMKITNTGRENDNMNQVFRGIDFELQAGNRGALALFMHAAQGGAVQDVTVRMVDAFAGFGGGGGAGASHVNIAAYGGQYGVYFAESEPGPLVAGGVFVGQTKSAIVLTEKAQGPIIITGARVELARNATGPAIMSEWNGTFFNGQSQGAVVVDVSINCAGGGRAAITKGAYMRNVWMQNCSDFYHSAAASSTANIWSVAAEVASGQMWADSHCILGASIMNLTASAGPPPSDLVERHIWDEKTFPSFEDNDVTNAVLQCGAAGDGKTDDSTALQRCLDKHGKVFLPKGIYRLAKTLLLPARGALVGLSQTHSVLAPTVDFAASARAPQPLLRTAARAPVTLAFVGLVTHWHVDGAFTMDWQSRNGIYRSNYETRVCECMWLSDYGSNNTAHGVPTAWPPQECRKGVRLSTPKSLVQGSGRFYNFVSDEDILFTDHVGYRHLLVTSSNYTSSAAAASHRNRVFDGGDDTTTDRLAFYSLNLEHGQSEANGEIRGAAHVDVYGFKKEGSTVSLWVRDSTDINIFAAQGSYTALQNASQYPEDFQRYTPSLYRIERTSPLKVVGVGGTDGCGAGTSPGPDTKCKGVLPCHNYPMSMVDMLAGQFPHEDWPTLLGPVGSLWQPWCGYRYPGAIELLEADGVGRELVATTSPGAVYMRGYPRPRVKSTLS